MPDAARCPAEFVLYERRPGAIEQRPTRIVRCRLAAGHDGQHDDGEGERWVDSDVKPWTPQT